MRTSRMCIARCSASGAFGRERLGAMRCAFTARQKKPQRGTLNAEGTATGAGQALLRPVATGAALRGSQSGEKLWSDAGDGSRRQGVALLDGLADAGARLVGREAGVLLDGGGLVGQALVLDAGAEPARVVAPPQMIAPRLVVHALRELQE